ncbi:MAG: acyl-CoA dehydrogenase family protein [Actinomycetes bacterium]
MAAGEPVAVHRVLERDLPSTEAVELLSLVTEIARDQMAPRVTDDERHARFPRDVFDVLGRSGLFGLPYPEQYGGAGQPYQVYLQVLEELSRTWLAVGLGLSVHTLACFPLASFGTTEQRQEWLPHMLDGTRLGAYALSEAHSGSDAAALSTRAVADPAGEGYTVTGAKSWITHGGYADFYTVMARTSDEGPRGISAFLVEAGTEGLSAAAPERKMGMSASPTAQLLLDGVRVPARRRIGAEGQGFPIALAGLDTGRLGIAACAVGLAQAGLDAAVGWARSRRQFGRRIIDNEGLGFQLADMAASVASARATYLDAARRRDRGLRFSTEAAVAKLIATDAAMSVTSSAVGVFGGYGYVEDYPVERYLREAKVLQIVEGTNQVQRLVIARGLAGSADPQPAPANGFGSAAG